jgi:ABC-2 type transport system permease protein
MKALQIAWKDTLTRFRDWKALVGLLGAPLIISALMGLAFGNIDFGGTQPPLSEIPVVLVDLDDGVLGQAYRDTLTSADLSDLLTVTEQSNLEAARAEIQNGDVRAVVYIPTGFTEALIPSAADFSQAERTATVQVFIDPTASVSPIIVQSIVEQVTAGINTVLLAGDISTAQVGQYAAVLSPQMANLGPILQSELSQKHFDFQNARITLEKIQVGKAQAAFDPFAFFIPGMAVFFLMFSMFEGSRSVLIEQTRGTLPRLMTTPIPTSQIILGKMGGTFMTGILQFTILVIASTLIFQVSWGHSLLGLATIVVLTVFAASGLGAFLTTFVRNENQAAIVGSTVSLIFGALGGSFFPAQNLTGIVDIASKLTVNRWAMEGLIKLTTGGGTFIDILPEAAVLGLIGLVTFSLALYFFKRRFVR